MQLLEAWNHRSCDYSNEVMEWCVGMELIFPFPVPLLTQYKSRHLTLALNWGDLFETERRDDLLNN